MQKKRPHLLGILLLLFIVGCNLPSSNPQPPAPPTLLSITHPESLGSWPQLTSLPVRVQVSRPNDQIARLALYANGALAGEQALQTGQTLAEFSWVASIPGEQRLVVRALDASGRVIGQANPVQVMISEQAARFDRLYFPVEGDTLENVAALAGVPAQEILVANPGLQAGAPLSVASPLRIPYLLSLPDLPAAPDVPYSGASAPASPYVPNPLAGWWNSVFPPPTAPATPGISATVAGCAVNLSIIDNSDNEDGFHVYRLGNEASQFEKIATLAAGSGGGLSFSDPGLSGQVTYYAAAFNGAGETSGSLAGVSIDDSICAALGGSQLASASPLPPGGPIPETAFQVDDSLFANFYEKTYYYISLDGSPWSRVPRLPDQFFTPENGLFELDAAIAQVAAPPASGQTVVDLEAWGWRGGDLIFIGRFQRVLQAEGESYFVLDGGRLTLCDYTQCSGEFDSYTSLENSTDQPGNQQLQWNLAPGPVTEGLWQVSAAPFEAGCEVGGNEVLLSGEVSKNNNETRFSIDMTGLPRTTTLGPVGSLGNVPGGLTLGNLAGVEMAIEAYYIRVIPLINGAPECSPSNTVVVRIAETQQVVVDAPPAAPAPPMPYDVKIIDFKPIELPQAEFMRCVLILENPYYGMEVEETEDAFGNKTFVNKATGEPVNAVEAILYRDIYKPGETICPAKYVYKEPSAWEKFTSFLKEAINTVSMVYNTLVAKLKEFVAKFNPMCLQGELIAGQISDSAVESVQDVCAAAAEIAVNAALSYVGLPPSLPNYEQLVEVGKGQAVDFAAQQIEEQTGLPCPDVCKEQIRNMLDETISQVEYLVADNNSCISESDAHNQGFEPLCIPSPPIRAVPEPRGQVQPALLTVEVSMKADAVSMALPDPALFKTACLVAVQSQAQNDYWIGKGILIDPYYATTQWQGASISGELYPTMAKPTPVLTPGESTQLTFVLEPRRGQYPPGDMNFLPGNLGPEGGFWLPGHIAYLQNKYNNSQLVNYYGKTLDDWPYLYSGALATFTASAQCTTTAAGYLGSSSQASDELITTLPAIEEGVAP